MPTSWLDAHLDRMRHSLVPGPEPDDYESDEWQLKLRAFIVLAHGAIEEHFEESISLCWTSIDSEDLSSPSLRSANAAIAFVLAARDENVQDIPRHIGVQGAIARARGMRMIEAKIQGNHGIRRKHTTGLLKALGHNTDPLETAIADLDALGAMRGEVAHASPLKGTGAPGPWNLYSLSDVLAKVKDAAAAASYLREQVTS